MLFRATVFSTLICLLSTLFYGCRKDEDTTSPIVNITTPYDNQHFTVYDTLAINAEVSDETSLEWITVGFTDENLTPVLNTVNIDITAKVQSIRLPYILYDLHMESGVYYVKISAFDGKNETNSYRKINITGAPRERTGIYILTENTSTTSIYLVDENFSITPKLTLNGDLSSAAVNSYNQDLYVAGGHTGSLNAIDTESHTVKWSVPVIPSSSPYFTNVYNDGKLSYISYYSGAVQAMDAGGAAKMTASAAQNLYPVQTLIHGSYLVTEQRNIASAEKKIVLYHANNGTMFQEALLYQEAIELFTKDANSVFIFGNNGSQGMMQIYEVSTNGIWTPHTLPAGRLLSVTQINGKEYLLGHENNIVYKYTYANNSLTPWLENVRATHLKYDEVTNEVVIADANRISRYSYANAVLLGTALHSDNISEVEILHNK